MGNFNRGGGGGSGGKFRSGGNFNRERTNRGGSGGGNFNRDRGNFGRDFGPREMQKATCSECGVECEVPFKPTEGKPVYCKECYSKRRRF
ncbi:DNA-directed RNA polymerase [Candidatus Woesearchaeota archaeon]|nr:DNA-directed RNA polymerase [Candidatus Woesearchaeota archaeon]